MMISVHGDAGWSSAGIRGSGIRCRGYRKSALAWLWQPDSKRNSRNRWYQRVCGITANDIRLIWLGNLFWRTFFKYTRKTQKYLHFSRRVEKIQIGASWTWRKPRISVPRRCRRYNRWWYVRSAWVLRRVQDAQVCRGENMPVCR